MRLLVVLVLALGLAGCVPKQEWGTKGTPTPQAQSDISPWFWLWMMNRQGQVVYPAGSSLDARPLERYYIPSLREAPRPVKVQPVAPRPPAPVYRHSAPSFQRSAPSYKPPAPVFRAPAPAYRPPAPSFSRPSYSPPRPSFGRGR